VGGKRREATAFRARQAQPAATERGCADAVFLKERRDDLLRVPVAPPGDHGDQDVEAQSAPQVGGNDAIVRSSIHPI
jgi:hypothetical protein